MAGFVYPATIFEHNDKKIILSEDVLVRLYGLINITDYVKGMTNRTKIKNGYEFGGWLLGYTDDEGNINFVDKNEESSNNIEDGAFKAFSDEKMSDEIFGNTKKGIKGKIENPQVNCLAHVHTHPASTESGRCFSQEDLDFYKKIIIDNYHIFGCMLSTTISGYPTDDDISFIKYDKNKDTFNFYPNVYWKNNETGEISPLKQIKSQNGKVIRTVMDENYKEPQK